ncbi:hypothetical protein EJ07DRAFT_38152, partial [Lizonia empirigonia]
RIALHDLIASLDDWSMVGQFAFGRWDGAVPPRDPIAGEPLGTEVNVVQSWHQPSRPHVTVRLVWAYAHVSCDYYVTTAHIYLDGSESLD